MYEDEITIYCNDCRGKFSAYTEDIVEGELIECTLCSAELEVIMEDPIKLRLYSEDNIF